MPCSRSSPSTGCRARPRRVSPRPWGCPSRPSTGRSATERRCCWPPRTRSGSRGATNSSPSRPRTPWTICGRSAATHTVGIQKTRVVRFITELAVAHPTDGLREHMQGPAVQRGAALRRHRRRGEGPGLHPRRMSIPEETAWRIMTVHWLEAMARLHGLEDVVMTGFSTQGFQTILEDIATRAGLGQPEDRQHRAIRSAITQPRPAGSSEAVTAGVTFRVSRSSAPLAFRPLGLAVVRTSSGCY